MLAPPNGGSEWADLAIRLRLGRVVLGRVATMLQTRRAAMDEAQLGSVDFDLGIIAGDVAFDPLFPRLIMPKPNDGKVSVAATKIFGMLDHITLPASHPFMMNNRIVTQQVLAFLRRGQFDKS